MILFPLPSYEYMAHSLLEGGGLKRGAFSVYRFTNKELSITLETSALGQECIVLGGTTPKNDELLTLLLLTHTLKTLGAKNVTVVTPYLSYARQDKKEAGKSLAASWIGEMLKASGADNVVTVEVHSPEVVNLFPLPLKSLSSAEIFAKELAGFPEEAMTLVTPDEGALPLAQALKEKLHIDEDVAYFKKTRTEEGVTLSELHGEAKGRAIVVDDLLDTGGTLIESAKKLREKGIEKITVVVTHGLFSGTRWEELWSLGVEHIYTTNTIPSALGFADDRITVLPVESLIVEYLDKQGM